MPERICEEKNHAGRAGDVSHALGSLNQHPSVTQTIAAGKCGAVFHGEAGAPAGLLVPQVAAETHSVSILPAACRSEL